MELNVTERKTEKKKKQHMSGGEQSHIAKEILTAYHKMYKSPNSKRSKSGKNLVDMKHH